MTTRRRVFALLIVPALLAAACARTSSTSRAPAVRPASASIEERLDYPPAPRLAFADELHGVTVADPYRWLEDSESGATKLWIEKQNELTFDYLARISAREPIRARMTELWDYERFGIPYQRGGRYFYTRNDGLQNQSVLYWTPSLTAEPRVLIDPNTLSSDGTMSLSITSPSDDGSLLAYGVSDGGSDWIEMRVREVATGRELPDRLQWVKFSSAAWTKDNAGFFYSRYDAPKEGHELTGANYYMKLYYHRIGTPQSQDELVYEDPDNKEWGFSGKVTDDGQWLIINVWKGSSSENLVYYKDLSSPGSEIVKLIETWDAEFDVIDNEGPVFWVSTNFKAPRGRVIAIDTRNPDRSEWREVIPQSDERLTSANIVDDRFIVGYLRDAQSAHRLYSLEGDLLGEVDLPGIGSAGGFSGKRTDGETFFSFTSFTTPGAIYRFVPATGQRELFREAQVDFNADDFETRQVFYKSRDGTRIPMFITHRKGIALDGSNPTYLYGYGGFDISLTPSFSVSNLVWMEMGGVLAVANLRGGGEYGKEWHDGGRLLKKQNVFDDFIAAAEWLIDEGYTSKKFLAIGGRSNGGLLVGACMTQRPDLYGACLPGVGVMDMLRFHKFTIGWAWVSDYGSPDEQDHFENLRGYSPLHNIQAAACYPPTFIVTADRDDRVAPAHSFKFAAALQAAQGCDNPVLIRIETRAGHGAGKPTSKIIEELTDQWAFLVKVLGMTLDGSKHQ